MQQQTYQSALCLCILNSSNQTLNMPSQATGGGGGIGIYICRSHEEVVSQYSVASRQGKANFGDAGEELAFLLYEQGWEDIKKETAKIFCMQT